MTFIVGALYFGILELHSAFWCPLSLFYWPLSIFELCIIVASSRTVPEVGLKWDVDEVV